MKDNSRYKITARGKIDAACISIYFFNYNAFANIKETVNDDKKICKASDFEQINKTIDSCARKNF